MKKLFLVAMAAVAMVVVSGCGRTCGSPKSSCGSVVTAQPTPCNSCDR